MAYEVFEVQREGGIDVANKGIRNYTRRYQVFSDIVNDDPGNISAQVPLLLYSSYPTDVYALLKQKKATQRMYEPHTWDVECTYDSGPVDQGSGETSGEAPEGDPGESNSDVQPDERKWNVQFDTITTTKSITCDLDGVPVCASNGQPFDPGLEFPAYHGQITLTGFKAVGADSYANMTTYLNKVNNGVWWGFADQTVLVKKYKLSSSYEFGQWWWNKEVVLEVNPDGPWNPVKVLDAGTYEMVSAGIPKYVAILDSTGNPVSAAVPLNGAGRRLDPASVAACASLVYREFKVYNKVSFAGLI